MRRSALPTTAPTGSGGGGGVGRLARSTRRLYSASGSVTVRGGDGGCCANDAGAKASRTAEAQTMFRVVMSHLASVVVAPDDQIDGGRGALRRQLRRQEDGRPERREA